MSAVIQYARYVTISLCEQLTGYTQKAIRMKIQEGVWIEGHEYIRAPDGRVLIDMHGIERWAEKGPA